MEVASFGNVSARAMPFVILQDVQPILWHGHRYSRVYGVCDRAGCYSQRRRADYERHQIRFQIDSGSNLVLLSACAWGEKANYVELTK
jgi:hypothetical protein